ncbi:MAG: hypothetical protein ACRD22_13440 [Terriglobia bacterium]
MKIPAALRCAGSQAGAGLMARIGANAHVRPVHPDTVAAHPGGEVMVRAVELSGAKPRASKLRVNRCQPGCAGFPTIKPCAVIGAAYTQPSRRWWRIRLHDQQFGTSP